jgi:hypothetical protein
MPEWIAEQVWAWGPVQVIVLIIGCVTAASALLLSRAERVPSQGARWLATIGLKAALVVLALTMLGLADIHRQVLEIEGFLASSSPPVPRDQKGTVLARLFTEAPVVLGRLVAVMLPVVTWVWVRVHRPGPDDRRLRMLAVAAAGVIAVALWGSGRWALEYVFPRGFRNLGGCRYFGYPAIDSSFESLDQHRILVVLGGVCLGVAAVGFAVAQTRRGLRLGKREWAALLALLGIAGAAKLWTTDERQDTRAYFGWERDRHAGFGRDPDLIVGPNLDHCNYDWPGSDLVFVTADSEQQPNEWLVQEVEQIEWCDGPTGIIAIRAEPTVAIPRVAIVLQAIQAKGWHRVGVMSLRPTLVSRATTGEFVRHRSCVVEFTLGPDGVPLTGFSTWAELAAAADAADGTLVINSAS